MTAAAHSSRKDVSILVQCRISAQGSARTRDRSASFSAENGSDCSGAV